MKSELSPQALHESTKLVDDLGFWLKQACRDTSYGEVGFVLVIHQRRVIRIKKLVEETRRLD